MSDEELTEQAVPRGSVIGRPIYVSCICGWHGRRVERAGIGYGQCHRCLKDVKPSQRQLLDRGSARVQTTAVRLK
jgi:hypothetical protein